MKSIFLSILFTIAFCALGQKQGNIWIHGEGAGIDFNSGAPIGLSGGQTKANPQNSTESIYCEGTASISDSSGNLLFYSNGESVWNRNHQLMLNSLDLKGMYSSTHAAFIIPQPNSDSLFYLFTTDGFERGLANGLRYSKIDMCLDNGNGDVVNEQKNVLLLELAGEKLAGAIHNNGEDYWLVSHKYNSNEFYSYKITESGISDTVISNVGTPHTNSIVGAIGQMKISSDGKRLGLVIGNIPTVVIEVFDFDDQTGIVSNPISLSYWSNIYGIEFSPNSELLYVSGLGGLAQFDLNAGGGSQSAVDSSITVLKFGGLMPCGIQLGPDGKIYCPLGVVHDPNNKGSACNFVDSLNYGKTGIAVTYPSFVAGFKYNNGIPSCPVDSSIGINTDIDEKDGFMLYPNPVARNLNIESSKGGTIEILDIKGTRILQTTIHKGNTIKIILPNNIYNGIYLIRLTSEMGIDQKKLIVNQN